MTCLCGNRDPGSMLACDTDEQHSPVCLECARGCTHAGLCVDCAGPCGECDLEDVRRWLIWEASEYPR